ncbi:heme exporter protein CcmD [Pseudidiomarina sp. 1APR75-33.1]|uniref:heme exporter protein CcmD n=1 Tax=Pseudidiomarina terrestris TaxID=2820060 RepID=UPI00264E8FFF|nr:heme exporter protein CcmD [Pseudidiomarina sp. 1APR75-33.1]MDN7126840.1 heme exporter protein CcmD [Pseudidiomarina sp. 1APR75-33.1]
MVFDNLQAFIAMGGYGFYVWLAFGISFAAIAVLVITGLTARRKLQREFVREQRRQERLAQRKREVS